MILKSKNNQTKYVSEESHELQQHIEHTSDS
jgi:hypothetical protein